ncbi:MAG: GHKL domain-containing protein [Ruminococcus sp.]|nr:GHKL domain-containing protein [Ruminococcus sp.]
MFETFLIWGVGFILLVLTSVLPALIIKVFYDDNVAINLRRILLNIGIMVFVWLISGLYLLTKPLFSTFILILSLTAAFMLLIVMPLVYFRRRGMGIKYHIEGLLMNFIAFHFTFVDLAIITELIKEAAVLFGADLAESSSNLGTPSSVAIFLVMNLLLCVWLWFSYIRRKIFLRMRKFDTLLFVLYHVLVNFSYIITSSIYVTALPDMIRASQLIFTIGLMILVPVIIIKNRQTAYYNDMSTRNEQFLEAELVASNIYRQSQEDTRAFRHDMNNNLAVLAALMKKGSYPEAESYINELHGRLSAFSPRIVTGDDMLDALISSKLASIEEKGIEFTINGIMDGGFGWKPIDICAVFANMIDNAVEACERMSYGKKYITMNIRKTDHQRIITMSNSTAEWVDCSRLGDGTHYTSKADSSSHGFGVKNIRDTLARNGAMMQLSCTATEFTTTILIMRTGAML